MFLTAALTLQHRRLPPTLTCTPRWLTGRLRLAIDHPTICTITVISGGSDSKARPVNDETACHAPHSVLLHSNSLVSALRLLQIPEAIYVHDNQKNASQGDAPTSVRHFAREFDKDKIWDRIRDGFHLGQCLVSASTGALTEAEQENMGLVDRHAYAVLQVHEVSLVPLTGAAVPVTSAEEPRRRGRMH